MYNSIHAKNKMSNLCLRSMQAKEVSEGKDQGLSLTYEGVPNPVYALARAYVYSVALPNSVLSSNGLAKERDVVAQGFLTSRSRES